LSSPIAYLLITHGSRNPQSTVSAKSLLENLQPYLPNAQLFHGQLEGSECPLHQQILTLADQLRSDSIDQLHLLPLFLIPGVHILEDLPQEIALAQQQLPTAFALKCHPYLGESLVQHPHLFPLPHGTPNPPIADSPNTPPIARILLTHGSKQPDSDRPIQQLAHALQAIPAYWSIEPSLPQQLTQLTQQGHRHIQILQYFLFPGTITEKLQALIQTHQQQNPDQTLTLTPTLDRLPTFLPLLAQILETHDHD
jgi:sirohydrochlorin cobaltochelatase